MKHLRLRWSACLAAASVAFSAAAAHGAYFRMSPQAGHPVPLIDLVSVPNAWQCWQYDVNGISPDASSSTCMYSEGSFVHWQVNPPTNSSGVTQTVNFWVQGHKGTRSSCFRAYSYSLNGNNFSATANICPSNNPFDVNLGNLSVPAYGTTTVVGRFTSLALLVDDTTDWNGVAWNYN